VLIRILLVVLRVVDAQPLFVPWKAALRVYQVCPG
jgi:hypothetical protein